MGDLQERSGRPSQLDPMETLQRENDALASMLGSLEKRIPSAEELAYLRERKLADDRASWAWSWLRQNMPAIFIVASTIGSGIYWAISHLSLKTGP